MQAPGGKTNIPTENVASCARCRYRISPGSVAAGVMYAWAYGTIPIVSGVSIAIVWGEPRFQNVGRICR